MAFSATRIVLPARPSSIGEFCIDRSRPCTVFSFTKLSGDTTANLDTKLEWCKEVIVLDSDGVTAIAATSTTGSGTPGSFTTALASLGAGTAGYVICVGNRLIP